MAALPLALIVGVSLRDLILPWRCRYRAHYRFLQVAYPEAGKRRPAHGASAAQMFESYANYPIANRYPLATSFLIDAGAQSAMGLGRLMLFPTPFSDVPRSEWSQHRDRQSGARNRHA
jgi:hypothetical protein